MGAVVHFLVVTAILALTTDALGSKSSAPKKVPARRGNDTTSPICPSDIAGSLILTSGSNSYTLSIPLDGKYHSTLGPDEEAWCSGPFGFTSQCQPCSFPINGIQNNYQTSCTLNLSSLPEVPPKIEPGSHYKISPLAELYGVTCAAATTDPSEKMLSILNSRSNDLQARGFTCSPPTSTSQTVEFTDLGGQTYTLTVSSTDFQNLIQGPMGCATSKGACISCSSFKVGSVALTSPNGPGYCRMSSPNLATAFSVYTYVQYGQDGPTLEWGPVNGIQCQSTPFPLTVRSLEERSTDHDPIWRCPFPCNPSTPSPCHETHPTMQVRSIDESTAETSSKPDCSLALSDKSQELIFTDDKNGMWSINVPGNEKWYSISGSSATLGCVPAADPNSCQPCSFTAIQVELGWPDGTALCYLQTNQGVATLKGRGNAQFAMPNITLHSISCSKPISPLSIQVHGSGSHRENQTDHKV